MARFNLVFFLSRSAHSRSNKNNENNKNAPLGNDVKQL